LHSALVLRSESMTQCKPSATQPSTAQHSPAQHSTAQHPHLNPHPNPPPHTQVVKEALSELELPYKQVTVSRGSPKRQQLLEKRGTFQGERFESMALCRRSVGRSGSRLRVALGLTRMCCRACSCWRSRLSYYSLLKRPQPQPQPNPNPTHEPQPIDPTPHQCPTSRTPTRASTCLSPPPSSRTSTTHTPGRGEAMRQEGARPLLLHFTLGGLRQCECELEVAKHE